MSETPTPRTDVGQATFALWQSENPRPSRLLVDAFLCSTIETELTAANARIAELEGEVNKWKDISDLTEVVLEAANADVKDLLAERKISQAELARLKAEGDGWLPIESAPTDGTQIWGTERRTWIGGEAFIQYVVFWNPKYATKWDDDIDDIVYLGDWDAGFDSDETPYPARPTHWRPLPPAPDGKGER